MTSQKELRKAFAMMDVKWSKQDDLSDVRSMFIYNAKTVDECIEKCKKYRISNINYVLHRWYNYRTSETCEELFEKYGAVREKKRNHRLIDIYITGVPFDIKLTTFPEKIREKKLNLRRQEDRDFLIQWFYANQSQASRKHFANRLFVVCDGGSTYEDMLLKSDIPLLEKAVKKYMEEKKDYPHQVTIKTDSGDKEVCSDIVVIEKSNDNRRTFTK